MKQMVEIQVKNMVCPRCVMAVAGVLENLGVNYDQVALGKVTLQAPLDAALGKRMDSQLRQLGFEILEDRDVKRIERMKNLLTELLLKEELPSGFNLMDHVRSHIPEDYGTLSKLFSSIEGMTLEKYFINLKIDKVKEWLFYEELNLSEIAWKLGYSSVQHLSSQFKKVTGMTPSEYKKLRKVTGGGWKE